MSQASKLSSSDSLRGLRPAQVNRDPGDETDERVCCCDRENDAIAAICLEDECPKHGLEGPA